ncbi:hypothetical protein N0Y54_32225 [Nostoc punctiforme UO1]|uniref:hypothetical protein n=1 Tax=Nostoc punctiforme TaxID=272131 RepID=UPI00309C45F7
MSITPVYLSIKTINYTDCAGLPPKERISVEMVFRGLYHFSRSLLRGKITDAVTYLVEHYQMLGLIKQERKWHP